MLLQRIQQHFIDSADLQYQCAQHLGTHIEAACGAVLSALTGGGKVLACGAGLSSGQALAFVGALVGKLERDRPELAAVAMGANAAVFNGLAAGFDSRQLYARQVRALGLPGDVLLLVTHLQAGPELQAAIEAAHERDMVVVALCGAHPGALSSQLRDTDVMISVPSERGMLVMEMHQVMLHCIADGIDVLLMGEESLENDE